MTKLIVNADDFGYSKGINLGIIEAHREGIVTSTTLMTNMPAVEHAVKLAKENEQLGVGIHFVLDCGFPVNDHASSLVDENGRLLKADLLIKHARHEDIKKELTSQLEKFFSFGMTPTHIDSHHHIHSHEKVFPIVCELAEKYQLPIRQTSPQLNTELHHKGIKMVEYFNPNFYGEDLDVNHLKLILQEATKYATVEIMTHPGLIDYPVLIGSSYHTMRAKELAILTDPEIKSYFNEHNIALATYKDI